MPGGFGAGVSSAGFDGENGLPKDEGALLDPVAGAGFGAGLGGAMAGRGGDAMLGGDGGGDAAGVVAATAFLRGAVFLRGAAFFAAALRTVLRAVLPRADFALRAVFFFAPALRRVAAAFWRRLAAGLARRFAAPRAAALRRFATFLVERAAFLRPERLDFDLDPERAIEPPVTGLEVAAFRVALATPFQHARRDEFRKGDSDVNPQRIV